MTCWKSVTSTKKNKLRKLFQTTFTPRCSDNEIITFFIIDYRFEKYETSSYALFSILSCAPENEWCKIILFAYVNCFGSFTLNFQGPR